MCLLPQINLKKFWCKVGVIVCLHIYNEILNKISKYFEKSSKERDLSGESNPEGERKKVRKGSSKTNNADETIDDEVFQQNKSRTDISETLVNLRKIEAKMAEMIIFTMKQNLCKLKETSHLLN